MIGTALALYVIGSMLYGAFYARQHPIYNYRTISFPNLPEDFDGYRIVQFSDLHLETLGSAANYLPRWINRINQLHPDLIVFTGDLVNRRGNELPPYMNVLSPSLRARWSIFYLGESRLRRLFPLGEPRRKRTNAPFAHRRRGKNGLDDVEQSFGISSPGKRQYRPYRC